MNEPDLFNLYPPRLSYTKHNSLRFRHPCKDCGIQNAPFGNNVKLGDYIKNPSIKENLGEWTCGLERCKHAT